MIVTDNILDNIILEFPPFKKRITSLYNESYSFLEVCHDYVLCLESIKKLESMDKLKMKKMKKMKLLFVFVLLIPLIIIGTELKAQSNWEVGMRFGDNIAIDATIPIGAAPRFHPAIYITDRFGVGGYFDWMFALSDGPSGLKFYPGVGPEFFFGNSFDMAIAGDFGAEYSFDFPLTIGFDWRPGFVLTDKFKGKAGNWGFIARFRIGNGKFVRAN